jgi:hypothetical protein
MSINHDRLPLCRLAAAAREDGATMKCKHDGCKERGELYYIEGYDPVPEFCFCEDHAAEFGFCLLCGGFIGGTEDVFLVGQTGLCFECFHALRDEMEYADSGEDDYDEGLP